LLLGSSALGRTGRRRCEEIRHENAELTRDTFEGSDREIEVTGFDLLEVSLHDA
jgi:hypothetical protein